MELLLVVSRTGRPPVDLRVDIDAAAPAAELIDALKDTVGATGPVDAYVARTASRLDPARTVSDARLVHGARLELSRLATVFTSSSGEGAICHQLCEALAAPAPPAAGASFTPKNDTPRTVLAFGTLSSAEVSGNVT